MANSETHALEIRIVSAQGECGAGHKLGDVFVIPGGTEQFHCSGLCIHALASMFPKLFMMRYGGNFPWRRESPETVEHLCPDRANPHVFEIRRVPGGERPQPR